MPARSSDAEKPEEREKAIRVRQADLPRMFTRFGTA